MLLPFDLPLLRELNQFVGVSPKFDDLVVHVSGDYLVKLTPMILVIWGFWFMKPVNGVSHKKTIMNGMLGCFITMATARGLSLVLPFRLRPLHTPELGLRIPEMMDKGILDGWSSLPSDHAALSFALASVVFMLHRRWGIWALLHAALIICLPRAYLSLHYPSDLLAGCLVGIGVISIMMTVAKDNPITRYALQLESSRPAFFYVGAFFLMSQMVQLFDPLRRDYPYFGSLVFHLFR